MDFISWLVFGVLFMLAEFAVGRFYLLAAGIACLYPAFIAYFTDSLLLQLPAFAVGSGVHILIVKLLRKDTANATVQQREAAESGQPVEIIEWTDESTARARYRGEEWLAEKVNDDLPSSSRATLVKVQYGRLLIATQPDEENPAA